MSGLELLHVDDSDGFARGGPVGSGDQELRAVGSRLTGLLVSVEPVEHLEWNVSEEVLGIGTGGRLLRGSGGFVPLA